MFDSNDFLKLIQEGKISPDTITRDFTNALNAALAAKKQADEAAAKKKAEEEAARKREELKAALEQAKVKSKLREADDIAARINAFMHTHYADVFAAVGEDVEQVTGAQFIEALDASMGMIRKLVDLKNHLADMTKNMEKSKACGHTGNCDCGKVSDPFADLLNMKADMTHTSTPHDPIVDFLKANKLL
jgi:fructose-1,6-bisphosphatase/sedoheptulose 1,7-bisphosphatase-like protein